MTKEDRVVRYLERAAKELLYDTGYYKEELGISDEDIREIQKKREAEISLKPTEKRNLVVKQSIKPLLKSYGYSVSGVDWRRELEDAYLIIHMINSQFNSIVTGANFRFHISAAKKEEIKGKLSDEWMYHQGEELNQFDFLPYCGMLSPYYSGGMYQIDGYKNFLPSDTPVEKICRQIEEDFGSCILPELAEVSCYHDFQLLRERKRKARGAKEIFLLRYYYMAQRWAADFTGQGMEHLKRAAEEMKLSREDILSHMEWLEICRENSDFPGFDAREFVRKSAEQRI